MKLLLISIHIEKSARAVPLGPAMLATNLKKELPSKIKTDILNLYLHQSAEECAKNILTYNSDCIGFSTYIWNRILTLEIISILKEKNPEIIIFTGGPEVSADPKEILNNTPIDFVLLGEGEDIIVQAMSLILDGTAPKEISQLVKPTPIKDLALLPSPFLDETLDPKGYTGMLWELSRGCPFKCDFCYESRGTSGIRRFPIDRIRSELKLFQKAGVKEVFVLDPTFNFNKKTAKEILKLIINEAPEIYFFFEVRAEFVDKEMAILFASINATLQIGIQSASNDVLKNINRTINKDSFAYRILTLHKAGAVYGFDLIYGLPGDTLDGFCKSIDFAMGLVPNHIDIFPLTVLPGTRLHETADGLGLEHEPDNPYRAICTPEFSKEDMAHAEEIAQACDMFYNQGKAVPWFDIMLNSIKMKPSEFFKQLADWLKTEPKGDIIELQTEFTTGIMHKQNKKKLIPIASDIIAYFGYTESLDDRETPYSFNYHPDDILDQFEYGVTDLKKLNSILST